MKRIYGVVVNDDKVKEFESMLKDKGFERVQSSSEALVSESTKRGVAINTTARSNYESVIQNADESSRTKGGPEEKDSKRSEYSNTEANGNTGANPIFEAEKKNLIVDGTAGIAVATTARDAPKAGNVVRRPDGVPDPESLMSVNGALTIDRRHLSSSDLNTSQADLLLDESLIRKTLFKSYQPSARIYGKDLDGQIVTVVAGPESSMIDLDPEFTFNTRASFLDVVKFARSITYGDDWRRPIDTKTDVMIADWYKSRFSSAFEAVALAQGKRAIAYAVRRVFQSSTASGVAWNSVYMKAHAHETGFFFGPCFIREYGSANLYFNSPVKNLTNIKEVADASSWKAPDGSAVDPKALAGFLAGSVGVGFLPVHVQQEMFATTKLGADAEVFPILERAGQGDFVKAIKSFKNDLSDFDFTNGVSKVLSKAKLPEECSIDATYMTDKWRMRPKGWLTPAARNALRADPQGRSFLALVDARTSILYGAALMVAIAEGFDAERRAQKIEGFEEGVPGYKFYGAFNSKIWASGRVLPSTGLRWSASFDVVDGREYALYADRGRTAYALVGIKKVKSLFELHTIIRR